jgi:hypothetical protein
MPNEFEEHHKAQMEKRAADDAAAEIRRTEILQRATKIQTDALEFAGQRSIVIGCNLNSPDVQLTKDGRQLTITVNGDDTYTLRRVWLHAVPPEETVSDEKMRDAVIDLILSDIAESPA